MTKTTITAIALSILAFIVAVVSLFGSHSTNVGALTPAGSPVNITPDVYANGLWTGARFEQDIGLTMNDRVNQASWKNTTGNTVYVSDAIFHLIPNAKNVTLASSSFNFFIGTSTTATVADQSILTNINGLIDTYVIATSSNATSTVASSNVKGGTNGKGVIGVAPGQYIVAALESVSASCTGGNGCESATSTNRGFNIFGNFRYGN